MSENDIATLILDCAFEVHRKLGPGLLESAYDECLAYKERESGLFVEQQLGLPLIFEEVKLNLGYRIDQRVEKKVIVEIKSVETLTDIHTAQILTYLRLSECKLGLLINFNTTLLKFGIKRVINGYLEEEPMII